MQFKIGDRVRIKEDLKEGWYDGTYFNEYLMGKHKGKEAIVMNYNDTDDLILNVDNGKCVWSESMVTSFLEEVKLKVGDKVRIKENLENKFYNGIFFNKVYMGEYMGKTATVTKANVFSYEEGEIVRLDIDNSYFNWSKSMLELIESKKEQNNNPFLESIEKEIQLTKDKINLLNEKIQSLEKIKLLIEKEEDNYGRNNN